MVRDTLPCVAPVHVLKLLKLIYEYNNFVMEANREDVENRDQKMYCNVKQHLQGIPTVREDINIAEPISI